MVVTAFKDIKFGDSSAEREKSFDPQLLLEGFLDANGYINKVVNGPRFLVYGQKGSGKSAICSRVELISGEDINVKVCDLQRFNYNNFDSMDSNAEAPEIKNIRSWEIILHIALLELFSKDERLNSIGGKDIVKNVLKDLEEVNILPAGDLSTIVNNATKRALKVNAKVIEYTRENQVRFYTNMYDNLRVAVHDSDLSKRSILFIDGLDTVITNKSNQKKILSGLLHAATLINEELHTARINAKIVVLCRTDILDMLNGPNLQKAIDDYGIELDWYQHGADRNDVNLIKMLNLRSKLSLKREVDIFEEFFPDEMSGKETFKFILDYTRYIPRDLIRLMNEIQANYRSPMRKSDFFNAINEYSASYFYGEIRNELHGMVSEDQIENILRLLSQIGKYKMTTSELENKSKTLGIKINLSEILPLLFNIGVIGNIRKIKGQDIFSFKFRERHSNFNPYNEIIVHLALQNTLKIRGGIDVKEVEYD